MQVFAPFAGAAVNRLSPSRAWTTGLTAHRVGQAEAADRFAGAQRHLLVEVASAVIKFTAPRYGEVLSRALHKAARCGKRKRKMIKE